MLQQCVLVFKPSGKGEYEILKYQSMFHMNPSLITNKSVVCTCVHFKNWIPLWCIGNKQKLWAAQLPPQLPPPPKPAGVYTVTPVAMADINMSPVSPSIHHHQYWNIKIKWWHLWNINEKHHRYHLGIHITKSWLKSHIKAQLKSVTEKNKYITAQRDYRKAYELQDRRLSPAAPLSSPVDKSNKQLKRVGERTLIQDVFWLDIFKLDKNRKFSKCALHATKLISSNNDK